MRRCITGETGNKMREPERAGSVSEAERIAAIQEAQMELFQVRTEFQAKRKEIKRRLEQLRANGEKMCRACRLDMPFEQFAVDRQKLCGRDSYCRECRKKKAA